MSAIKIKLSMSKPLVADGNLARIGGADRKITEVAVGVLVDSEGRYLMTTRPEGKVYAGYWEFPGGKLETGETVVHALRRELIEEIGVTISEKHTSVWREQMVDYPHALVRLHFCKVSQWSGELTMHEDQAFEWVTLPPNVTPILPGALPVLGWLLDAAKKHQ
jgi:8-oxo-dGTP diphosphatase